MALVRDVEYRLLIAVSGQKTAKGKTINISSSGVLFTVESELVPGSRIELVILWPAQLDGKASLKLVAKCRVIRGYEGHAAVEILDHEFRTKAA